MAIANKIGKEFRLLKKNFLLSNSLYKIFNRNMVKLSFMPYVASLINKNSIKNFGIINVLSLLNAVVLIKLIVPSRGSVNLYV